MICFMKKKKKNLKNRTYLICFDMESFVLLLRRTLNPEEKMTLTFQNIVVKDHIQQVDQLFTSINSCFNHVFEHTLSNPFQHNTEIPIMQDRCNRCPGCPGELEQLYGRIIREGAQDILFTTTSKYNIGNLVQLFLEQPDLNRRLFSRNRRNVPKRDIKLFIFQLVAWEILLPQYQIETKSIVFIASQISQLAMFTFQTLDSWKNISTF